MASTPQFSLPSGLTSLLEEFVVKCIQENPEDIVEFAADYFNMLKRFKKKEKEQAAPKQVQKNERESEDDLAPEPRPKGRSRRQAVSAEAYKPNAEKDWKPKFYKKTEDELKHLTEEVNKIVFLKTIDPEQLDIILGAFYLREVKEAGEIIIKQGDDGDNFYVINTGDYDVYINKGNDEIKVHTFHDTGMFGELALMYNCPRNATIKAHKVGSSLWALDRTTFVAIVVGAEQKRRERYKELLRGVNILSQLNEDELEKVCDGLKATKYKDGDAVIRENDEEAECMYFIEKGAVRVTVKAGGEENQVKFDKKYFGELALLMNQPRKATVYAAGDDCKFLHLDKGAFDRLLGPCVDILKRNAKEYEEQRKKLGIK